jgi:hypothetical protein
MRAAKQGSNSLALWAGRLTPDRFARLSQKLAREPIRSAW